MKGTHERKERQEAGLQHEGKREGRETKMLPRTWTIFVQFSQVHQFSHSGKVVAQQSPMGNLLQVSKDGEVQGHAASGRCACMRVEKPGCKSDENVLVAFHLSRNIF